MLLNNTFVISCHQYCLQGSESIRVHSPTSVATVKIPLRASAQTIYIL